MAFIVEPFDRTPIDREGVEAAADMLLDALNVETTAQTFNPPFLSGCRIRRGTIEQVAQYSSENMATKGSTFARMTDDHNNTVWFSYAEPIIWKQPGGLAVANNEWFSSTTNRHFSSAWYNLARMNSTRHVVDGMSVHYGGGQSVVRLNPRFVDTFLSADPISMQAFSNTNIENLHRHAVKKYELMADYWSQPGRRLSSDMCLSIFTMAATAAVTTAAMAKAHPGKGATLTPLFGLIPERTKAQYVKARLRGDNRADMLSMAVRLTEQPE